MLLTAHRYHGGLHFVVSLLIFSKMRYSRPDDRPCLSEKSLSFVTDRVPFVALPWLFIVSSVTAICQICHDFGS
jgi:hypothetical protein